MYVPKHQALQPQSDEDDEQICKKERLVVEYGDGFVGSADLFEPVKLTHFGYFLDGETRCECLAVWKWVCRCISDGRVKTAMERFADED